MMTKTKLADLQKAAQEQAAHARTVAEKAEGESRRMTEDEQSTYTEAMAKGRDLLEQIKVARRDLEILEDAKSLASEIGAPAVEDLDAQGNRPVRERVKSLGLQVIDSIEFKNAMTPFKGGHVGERMQFSTDPISVKGLFVGGSATSAGAFLTPEDSGIVETLGRKALTVRDLVSVRRTEKDAVEYVEQTSHTNAAAVVAEATSSAAPTAPGSAGALVPNANGGYKPEGSWAYERKTVNVKTIAQWVPATKRALADVAALEGLINDELRADIAETEEAQILNGNGSGENFTGINNWSGVQTQAFATDIITSIRKGITKARTVGKSNPTAIVVNPADAEAIDLLKDGESRYYFGGPYAIAQRTMWGLPVVESETQASGSALLGDFSKAVIWDREQTTVSVTDSHADFFIRNLVAILAEERLAFAVGRPTAFVKVALA